MATPSNVSSPLLLITTSCHHQYWVSHPLYMSIEATEAHVVIFNLLGWGAEVHLFSVHCQDDIKLSSKRYVAKWTMALQDHHFQLFIFLCTCDLNLKLKDQWEQCAHFHKVLHIAMGGTANKAWKQPPESPRKPTTKPGNQLKSILTLCG